MIGSQGDHDPGEEFASDLVDVTGLDIAALTLSDNSVLSNSIRRILADATGDDDVIAGFGENV